MTSIKRILTKTDPAKLVKHPLSLKIYGERPDEGFDDSIKRRGVDEPIVVAADGKTIISGVRRRNGAIKAKIKEVPILVRQDLVEGLDIEEAIIEANRHNEQTMEAKTRAYSRLKEIESERAAKRQKTQLKQGNAPVSTPRGTHGEKGRASDAAARQAGLGKRTAKKAAEVVAKIDEAEATGDTSTAADLRETLNKNVSEAHRKATVGKSPNGKPKRKKATREKATTAQLFDAMQRQHFSGATGLPQSLDRLAEAIGSKGPNYNGANDGLNLFLKHGTELRKGKP